jgi:hypothetical protein
MSRMFLIVLAAGLVVIAVVLLLLGAFPPTPAEHHIERTVPNAQIKGQ